MKRFNEKFGFLGWLLLVSLFVMGAKIGDDILRVGTKTGADIEVQMGEGRLQWDSATSKMKFSNDAGVTLKDIGSGGGGGAQNFFENGDAESGTLGWTNTGSGTFITFTSTPINGLSSYRWDAAAQNDVLRTDQVAIPEKFKGQACQIEFSFTGGTSDLVKPQVVDSSNVKLPGATFQNQIDGSDFLQVQTVIVTRSIFFICPSSGTIAFEFLQTEVGDPAAMDFDDVHIGQLKGLVESVLPDVFTATFSPSSVLVAENSAGAITVTDNGVGDYTYQLNFAHTISPACVVNDYSGNPKTACMAFLSDINTLEVICEDHQNGPFNAVDRGNVVVCHKQGVDVKQTVQVFNSIPTVAENINEFSAVVDASLGFGSRVTSTNTFWIDNVTRSAAGNYEVNFVAGVFSVPPSLTASPASAANELLFSTITNTSALVRTRDSAGAAVDSIFNIDAQKQGVDFKLPVVQPILIKQVETSIVQGMKIESCVIDATSGTPLFATSDCDNWITSISDNGIGDMNISLVAGIFIEKPTCVLTCGFSGGSECNAQLRTNTWSSGVFRNITRSDSAPADTETTIICTGIR